MKTKVLVGLFVLVAVVIALGIREYQRVRSALALEQFRTRAQVTLADSTRARLAASLLAQDSLAHVVQATKELNGKLRLALAIEVAARDTVVVHDTLVTTDSGTTRLARFRDSTFAGVIQGTVVAPPAPSPLRLSYRLTRPPFRPEIGLVQVGDSQVVVVNWQGETARIQAPYSNVADLPPRWNWYGEALAGYNHLTLALGSEWRVGRKTYIVTRVGQRVGAPWEGPQAEAGLHQQW